jgi:hypothetical protein
MRDNGRPIEVDGETYYIDRVFDGSPAIFAVVPQSEHICHVDRDMDDSRQWTRATNLTYTEADDTVLIVARRIR